MIDQFADRYGPMAQRIFQGLFTGRILTPVASSFETSSTQFDRSALAP